MLPLAVSWASFSTGYCPVGPTGISPTATTARRYRGVGCRQLQKLGCQIFLVTPILTVPWDQEHKLPRLPELHDQEVSFGQQPGKSGHQMHGKALVQETLVLWSTAEGERENSTCQPARPRRSSRRPSVLHQMPAPRQGVLTFQQVSLLLCLGEISCL